MNSNQQYVDQNYVNTAQPSMQAQIHQPLKVAQLVRRVINLLIQTIRLYKVQSLY